MRLRLVAPILLSLAACAAPAARGPVPEVPAADRAGTGDPERQAVLSAAYAFTDTSRLDGRPAEAARSAARLEWMAASIPGNPRWVEAAGTLGPQLAMAREELHGALGLAPAASPVAVTRAFTGAATALDAGNRAAAASALAPVAPGGGEAVLARLDHLPQLPRAAAATRLAQQEMIRPTRDNPD
jgi:hypothetical protein